MEKLVAATTMAAAPDLPSYEDETPAPPGWKRKLVPRMGKGLTPTKTDVVYIAPDGEEIKSKAALQRYLKAHKDGTAISEFNWSSGETPRRSGRLTLKSPPNAMEVDVLPKSTKRKSREIPHEESNMDQPLSPPPPKGTKKAGKNSPIESNDAVGGSIAEDKEAVKECEEGHLNPEAATKPVVANGAVHNSQDVKMDDGKEEIMAEQEAAKEVGSLSDAKFLSKSDAANGEVHVCENGENAGDVKEGILDEGNIEMASKTELTLFGNLNSTELSMPISQKSKESQARAEPDSDEIPMKKDEMMATMAKEAESLEPVNFSAEEKNLESQTKGAENTGAEQENPSCEANHDTQSFCCSGRPGL